MARKMVSFRADEGDVVAAYKRADEQGLEFSYVMRVLLGIYAGGGFPFTDALSPRLVISREIEGMIRS